MPRPGFITASSFDALMSNGRGSDSMGKTALSECRKIAMRWHGVQTDFESFEMRRGTELEPQARDEYNRINMVNTIKPEFQSASDFPEIGGTCDGLVGISGMIEIKCPNSANHLENIESGAQIADYEWQIQGYLWIYQREWCDFVSYDDRFPIAETQLWQQRIERNEAKINALKARLKMCLPIVKQTFQMLESRRTA